MFNLAVELANRGHQVRMILMDKSNNKKHYKERLHEWKGCVVNSPGSNYLKVLLYILLNIKKFVVFLSSTNVSGTTKKISAFIKYSLINSGDPEIIHFAYTGLAIEFIDILHLTPAGTKIIVSARGTGEIVKPAIDKNRPILLSRLWYKVDAVHCVSADMAFRLEKLGLSPLRCFVNYPSINIDNFSYVGRENKLISVETSIRIVSTGRLHYSKGYVYSLPAIRNLLNKGYNLEYHILGDGPDKEMLQFIAADLQLQNTVFFHGKVSSEQVKNHLKEANIYLLPSLYEGISNAALEAMAVGVPIVTTDAGGMAEVVTEGESGYLISRYSIDSITSCLEHIINDYQGAVSMTLAARKIVENRFNLKNQIDIFEKEYKQCLTQ